MCCCPVHDESEPSFLITEAVSRKDGQPTITMHCFSCMAGIDEICAAMGITIADLYPERMNAEFDGTVHRQKHAVYDVWKALEFDVFLVGICAKTLSRNEKLDKHTTDLLTAAQIRIQDARQYC